MADIGWLRGFQRSSRAQQQQQQQQQQQRPSSNIINPTSAAAAAASSASSPSRSSITGRRSESSARISIGDRAAATTGGSPPTTPTALSPQKRRQEQQPTMATSSPTSTGSNASTHRRPRPAVVQRVSSLLNLNLSGAFGGSSSGRQSSENKSMSSDMAIATSVATPLPPPPTVAPTATPAVTSRRKGSILSLGVGLGGTSTLAGEGLTAAMDAHQQQMRLRRQQQERLEEQRQKNHQSKSSVDEILGLVESSIPSGGRESPWHKPTLLQMVETLQASMMKEGVMASIPVKYNSHVLGLLEGFAQLTKQLRKTEQELAELKFLREKELEQFRGISEEWIQREDGYKAEIRRLEVVLAKESKDGVASVALARHESLVDRSGAKRFQARLKRMSNSHEQNNQEEAADSQKESPSEAGQATNHQKTLGTLSRVLGPDNDARMSRLIERREREEQRWLVERQPALTVHARHQQEAYRSQRPAKKGRPGKPEARARAHPERQPATMAREAEGEEMWQTYNSPPGVGARGLYTPESVGSHATSGSSTFDNPRKLAPIAPAQAFNVEEPKACSSHLQRFGDAVMGQINAGEERYDSGTSDRAVACGTTTSTTSELARRTTLITPDPRGGTPSSNLLMVPVSLSDEGVSSGGGPGRNNLDSLERHRGYSFIKGDDELLPLIPTRLSPDPGDGSQAHALIKQKNLGHGNASSTATVQNLFDDSDVAGGVRNHQAAVGGGSTGYKTGTKDTMGTSALDPNDSLITPSTSTGSVIWVGRTTAADERPKNSASHLQLSGTRLPKPFTEAAANHEAIPIEIRSVNSSRDRPTSGFNYHGDQTAIYSKPDSVGSPPSSHAIIDSSLDRDGTSVSHPECLPSVVALIPPFNVQLDTAETAPGRNPIPPVLPIFAPGTAAMVPVEAPSSAPDVANQAARIAALRAAARRGPA